MLSAAVVLVGSAHAGPQRPELQARETLLALESLAEFSEAGWVSCPLPKGMSAKSVRMTDVGFRVVDGTYVAGLVEQSSGATVVKPRLDVAACGGDAACLKSQEVDRARGVFRWTGADSGTKGTCVFEPVEWVKIPGTYTLGTPLEQGDSVGVYGCEGVEMKSGASFEITAIVGLPCSVTASMMLGSEVGEVEVLPAEGASVAVTLGPRVPAAAKAPSRADAGLDRALASSDLAPELREIFTRWKRERDAANAARAERMKALEDLESDVDALLRQLQ